MMADGDGYSGSGSFTPRERLLLKLMHLEQVLGARYMRWRYRGRVSFGRGCRVDHRTFLLSGLGRVILEDGVIIERGVNKVAFHLEPESRVTLGRGVWIQTFDSHTVFSCKRGAEIIIGERCWFSGGIFGASEKITVGDHTLIGWGCMILDSDMHRMDNEAGPVTTAPVEIGSHVWMPSNISVLKGVRIGDHCVIGAGSMVTRDIPKNSFAAGCPARVIRKIGGRDLVE